MGPKANKGMIAAQLSHKQRNDAQVREQTPFFAAQLTHLDHAPWFTSASDKMALEAYSKLLPRAVGPRRVISFTVPAVSIN